MKEQFIQVTPFLDYKLILPEAFRSKAVKIVQETGTLEYVIAYQYPGITV